MTEITYSSNELTQNELNLILSCDNANFEIVKQFRLNNPDFGENESERIINFYEIIKQMKYDFNDRLKKYSHILDLTIEENQYNFDRYVKNAEIFRFIKLKCIDFVRNFIQPLAC